MYNFIVRHKVCYKYGIWNSLKQQFVIGMNTKTQMFVYIDALQYKV